MTKYKKFVIVLLTTVITVGANTVSAQTQLDGKSNLEEAVINLSDSSQYIVSSESVFKSIKSINIISQLPQSETVVLSPQDTSTLIASADGFMWSGNGSGGNSTVDYLRIGYSTTSGANRSVIKFDLSSIPSNAIISDADLSVYYDTAYGSNSTRSVEAHRITSSWVEGSLSWNNNYSSYVEDTSTVGGPVKEWQSWDIDDLVGEWVDGTYPNYGVLLRSVNESGSSTNLLQFWSKDYLAVNFRPILEVDYSIPTDVIITDIRAQQDPVFPGDTIDIDISLRNDGGSGTVYVGGSVSKDPYAPPSNYCNTEWKSKSLSSGSTGTVSLSWVVPADASGIYNFFATTFDSCVAGCEPPSGSSCYLDGCCTGEQDAKYALGVFEVLENQPPSINLTQPSSNITVNQGDNVLIQWTDDDQDDNAYISLARDTDNDPENGIGHTFITNQLEDPDGSGDQYNWDTSGVPTGTYYVWGMIYDGFNTEVYDVAPGRVTVQIPVIPTITSINPTSGPRNIWVDINGSNFGTSRGTNGRVDFGGVYITTNVIDWTDTKIVVAVPPELASTGDKTVTVRNDYSQTSNGVTFYVADDPNAIITNSPKLSCPTSAIIGQPFDVTATLRNGASGAAEHGGVSFSFPNFTLQDTDLAAGGPYETSQGRVETILSDGATVSYFDEGDSIDKGGTQGNADHLLVESDDSNWPFGEEEDSYPSDHTW